MKFAREIQPLEAAMSYEQNDPNGAKVQVHSIDSRSGDA